MRASSFCPTTAGTLVVLGALLAGCGVQEQTPEPEYTDFPDAPPQKIAPLNTGADPARGPIAELTDPEWVKTTAARTGISERALAAYAGASLRIHHDNPQCNLGWNAIAGIGAVETAHGTFQGASVDAQGNVTPHIRGVALNGDEGVMAIEDTDDGTLDGDRNWDRAVGPMQFIPSTWQSLGQDGNGDGTRDPHQIDDAALATAVHLCEGAVENEKQGDVSVNDSWHSAVYSYNRSRRYAHQVTDYANHYAGEASS